MAGAKGKSPLSDFRAALQDKEMEMMSDHTSREKYYDYNKTATYDRSDDGSESIIYQYGKPPGFWEKIIVLPKR